jgi:cytochrome c peroxidase
MRSSLLISAVIAACSNSSTPEPRSDASDVAAAAHHRSTRSDDINPRQLRRFKALVDEPAPDAATIARIDLGRQLFFDKRLSKDGDLSCNSCHQLDKYGVDGEPTSPGTQGQRGRRNSPTVYHAGGEFTSFWDGRAANVEEQAKGPILNPIEMGMPSGDAVVAVIAKIPGYVAAFQAAFPDERAPLTYDNLGRAIGAFERRLVTPGRWDRYLAGDHSALAPDEIAGLKIFTDIGCITCHTGEFVGGSMFQKAGFVKPWPNQRDRGRYELTKRDADDMMFKVPSLRNVARTAPYFHDGSVATLSEAVRMMARHQLGEELTDEETRVVVAWLGSLTGTLPTALIKEPVLPPDPH